MLDPVIAEVLAGLVIVWFAVRLRHGRISRNSAVGVRNAVHDAQRRGLPGRPTRRARP